MTDKGNSGKGDFVDELRKTQTEIRNLIKEGLRNSPFKETMKLIIGSWGSFYGLKEEECDFSMNIHNWIDFLERERGKIPENWRESQQFFTDLRDLLLELRSDQGYAAMPSTSARAPTTGIGAQSGSGGSGGAGGTGEASMLKSYEEQMAEFSQLMQGDMQRRRGRLQKYNGPPATMQPPTKEVAERAVRKSTPPEVSRRMMQAQSVVRRTIDEEQAQKYFDEMTRHFTTQTRDSIIERLQELKDNSKKRNKTPSPEGDNDDLAKRRRRNEHKGEGGGGADPGFA
jgi:hypothetical protein